MTIRVEGRVAIATEGEVCLVRSRIWVVVGRLFMDGAHEQLENPLIHVGDLALSMTTITLNHPLSRQC